jgi:hypothetical protein
MAVSPATGIGRPVVAIRTGPADIEPPDFRGFEIKTLQQDGRISGFLAAGRSPARFGSPGTGKRRNVQIGAGKISWRLLCAVPRRVGNRRTRDRVPLDGVYSASGRAVSVGVGHRRRFRTGPAASTTPAVISADGRSR